MCELSIVPAHSRGQGGLPPPIAVVSARRRRRRRRLRCRGRSPCVQRQQLEKTPTPAPLAPRCNPPPTRRHTAKFRPGEPSGERAPPSRGDGMGRPAAAAAATAAAAAEGRKEEEGLLCRRRRRGGGRGRGVGVVNQARGNRSGGKRGKRRERVGLCVRSPSLRPPFLPFSEGGGAEEEEDVGCCGDFFASLVTSPPSRERGNDPMPG